MPKHFPLSYGEAFSLRAVYAETFLPPSGKAPALSGVSVSAYCCLEGPSARRGSLGRTEHRRGACPCTCPACVRKRHGCRLRPKACKPDSCAGQKAFSGPPQSTNSAPASLATAIVGAVRFPPKVLMFIFVIAQSNTMAARKYMPSKRFA